jgi:PAS domain S-box-containing protein
MRSDHRKSGIPAIAELPWGSHFCQFYAKEQDVAELLLPYFRAGLDDNEFCVWVTPDPAEAETRRTLAGDPWFAQRLATGQLEVISVSRWEKLRGGSGTPILPMLDTSIFGGFDGVRLGCSGPRRAGDTLLHDELDAVTRNNVVALYAYPRDEFDALGLMEMVKSYRFALVRNGGNWEVIESYEAKIVRDELKKGEEKLKHLFSNMSSGFAYHRIMVDRWGTPVDYVFLEVNDAFEKLTGLKGEDIVGKRVTAVVPGIERDCTDWISVYGKVALSGEPVQFESYTEPLKRWFGISAFSPQKGYFAVTISDITQRKEAESEIRKLNEELKENLAELYAVNSSLRDSRLAALNLMEDAVAARKQAEEASAGLRQSEAQFRTLANAIPQLCWTANADGWITWYNQRWYDYTGATPEDMEGWGWQSVHDADLLPSVMERWQASLATGKPFEMVFPLRGADGMFRPFLTRAFPVCDGDGRVLRWFGTNTDIEAQRRTEEELHRSNARLNILAETASDLLRSDTPQNIVDQLCRRVLSFLDCQAFFNFLVDEESGRLRLNACAGIPQEEIDRIEWLEIGVAICGCAARDACRIVAQDIQNVDDPRTDLVRSYGIQAYACHPLMVQGRVHGTVSFGTTNRKSFTEEELALMKAVADHVSIAMERQRMEGALRSAHDELEGRVKERTEELAATVETLRNEIDERQRTEAKLQRLNRLQAVLSEIDQAIVRASDRQSLFHDFCRIATEQGEFLLAWVGVLDEGGNITPVAASGATAYLEDIRIPIGEEPEGEGPTGISLREGTYYICNDFQNDPCTRPWHEKGGRHGINSSASIALKEEGRVIGALTLYGGEKDAFDGQHEALLRQMGADISFALDNLLREERRRTAEQALRGETLERLRAVEDLREKERLLIQQSRQAAMGEMIGNIAHQWRQPLNTLGLMVQELSMCYEVGQFSQEYLDNTVQGVMQLVSHMSQTIDDFRNFFRPEKEKTKFRVRQAVQNVISIVSASLKEHRIEVEVSSSGNPQIQGYPNEYSQVLLNIMLNARDAFNERGIEKRRIEVRFAEEDGRAVVTIADNAGGIPEEILDRIFDPYFTTKGPDKGTGVGLYMSKSIIEKNMNGRLTARNRENGAQFRIEV